jgi:AsmA family protein
MSQPYKIALIALGVLAALLVAGASYLSTLISPDKLTQRLIAEVRDATGRELTIAGPVSLHFFPTIAVSAEQLSFSNAPWSQRSQMADLEKVALEINLMPLLSRRIEVSRVELSGLHLHLETNAKGEGNWQMGDALASSNKTKSSTSDPLPASAQAGSTVDTADGNLISIENLQLSNGRIDYLPSGSTASRYQIARIAMQGGGGDTVINTELKQDALAVTVKGKMTSIREILQSIGSKAIDVAFDFEVGLNSKPAQLKGTVALDPVKPSQFALSFKANELDLSALPAFASTAAPTTAGPAASPINAATKALNAVTAPNQAATTARTGEQFFSDAPLPLQSLPNGNGSLDVEIAQLVLPSKVVLNKVAAVARLSPQQIDVPQIGFLLGSGQFDGSARISNTQGTPNWAFKGGARGFTLEQLLASTASKGKVSGGDMRAAFSLTSSGKSPHQIASNLNGQSQITVGSARLASSFLNQGGDVLVTLFDAINPMRKKSNETVLECAVVYLPAKGGVVSVADSVGIETDRLNVVLAGSINLNSERINLAIYPKEKSGLSAGVDLANLVRLQGTLVKPQVGVNKEAVVNQALALGLGFLTGGASIIAQNAEGVMNKPHPCRDAMRSWESIYLRS